jgi:cytochrome c oxidase assembly factor CtaG
MQWWCAAQGVAWDWSFRPYPGVWAFVALLLAALLALRRRSRALEAVVAPPRPRRDWTAFAGLALLWVALDWPVGALGAGYLASLHMVQFLLIGMAVPPLLLLGVPAEAVRSLAPGGTAGRALRRLTHPAVTLATFNVIVIATHTPAVSDALMPSQWGSFLIDVAWLAAGLLYWWPIAGPGERRPRFSPPLQMGYLFATMVIMTMPGAMITFSELPIFATYELAPRVNNISAVSDQRVAGLLMKLGGGAIVWVAISIIFYRWNQEERRMMDRELAAATAARRGRA